MTAVLDHLAIGTPDSDRRLGTVRRRPRRNVGLRRRLRWLLVGPAGVRRRTEDRADDTHPRSRRGLPGALPGYPRAGPHHFNFIVTDIEATLARIRAAGIEPVQVNLSNPYWKEAFLHPRDAHGIVIQVAQQAGSARVAAPRELPEPGPPACSTDRAPRRRPSRRDAAVPGGPGRPARSRRRRHRGADLARRQADQAGARGRPAPRRVAASRSLQPSRRRVQRAGPGAREPAGQAPRPDGGTGLAQRALTRQGHPGDGLGACQARPS